MPHHTAFMSYTHFDDQHNGRHLTLLRARLASEVQAQTGQPFEIFQDTQDIAWGQQVEPQIDAALQAVTFLIPILTPSFFTSRRCRYELEQFLQRERRLGRNDLVLPVYYIDCPILEEAAQRTSDPLAEELAKRQCIDWRTLRFEPIEAPEVRRTLAEMAKQLSQAMQRFGEPSPGRDSSPGYGATAGGRQVPNPFGRTGKIDDPAEFFNRELLLHQVFDELRKGCNLSLIGLPQIGKSSLLGMIKAWGPERLGWPSSAFLSLNMQLIADEQEFFEALCEELGIAPACRGRKLWRVLRQQGRRAVLCLDEIEKMQYPDRFSVHARDDLRGLADGASEPLTLVIASSMPLDHLFPHEPGTTSPLHNICSPLTIPPFSPDEVHDFIRTRLQGTGITFSQSHITRLIAESGGHPGKLQRLAAELFREVVARE